MPLHLHDILGIKGFGFESRTKLVRHQSPQWDLRRLIEHDQLELYQSCQSKPVFSDCNHIVSFLGSDQTAALLIGIYKVQGHVKESKRWPTNYIYPTMLPGDYWYQLEKVSGFEDLEHRLVIEWGLSTRSWHQWYTKDKPKAVVEYRQKGKYSVFPGYDDAVVKYADLKQIITNPEANRDWKYSLSKVAGVYLIHDVTSGMLYVGSAYGINGIWGRWESYVRTGHGGNVELRALMTDNEHYHENFVFSVLKTLPISSDKDDVLKYESIYKNKFGSRCHGLNSN